jgi:putative membrane protein
MKTLTIVLAGAALTLGACHKNEAANNTSLNDVAINDVTANDSGDLTNMSAAATPTTAQGFANAAAASDKFEIETSKLAATAAQSSAVKKFADQMISAHTSSTAKLKSILAGTSPAITPDDTLNPDQQSTLRSLQSKKGADFDSAYATAQADAHQKTLTMLNAYASGGDNAKLQDFAKQMIPTVTAHLNLAKGLK